VSATGETGGRPGGWVRPKLTPEWKAAIQKTIDHSVAMVGRLADRMTAEDLARLRELLFVGERGQMANLTRPSVWNLVGLARSAQRPSQPWRLGMPDEHAWAACESEADVQVTADVRGSSCNPAEVQLHSDRVRRETKALNRTAPALRSRRSGAVFRAVTVGFESTEACTSHAFESRRGLLQRLRKPVYAA
jgi:hypothetical protein